MSLKGIRKSDGTAEYIYADDTLSEENAPGEAKAAGDRIAGVEGRVTTLETAAPESISNATKDWLDDNVTPTGSAVAIDSSLTQSGLAADAKATGDAVNDLKSDLYALLTPLPSGYEATGSIPPTNADTSKKYVMPNGDVYAWSTHTVTEPYNANTGLINQRPITNNPYNDFTAESGVLTSDLIPFSEDWIPSTADRTNSSVTIKGIEKIVPVAYSSSLIVYYYAHNGNSLGSLRTSQIASINLPLNSEINLPITFHIKDVSGVGSHTWDEVGYVRILLGISTSGDITATDISNLVISVPYYDEESEIGGWVATGENIPMSQIDELADRVTEVEEAVSTIFNIDSNQSLYVVGDSIANGYRAGGQDYSWVAHAISRNGYNASNCVNLAESGLGFATASTSSNTVQNIVGGTDFSSADIVVVALGINDWKNYNILLTDVWDGMEYVFNKIRTDNPYCKIFYITPLSASFLGSFSSFYCVGTAGDSNALRPYGNTLRAFVNMIKAKFSESPFDSYDVTVLDMIECASVNRNNIETALADHLHPTADTQEALGYEIGQRLALGI